MYGGSVMGFLCDGEKNIITALTLFLFALLHHLTMLESVMMLALVMVR